MITSTKTMMLSLLVTILAILSCSKSELVPERAIAKNQKPATSTNAKATSGKITPSAKGGGGGNGGGSTVPPTNLQIFLGWQTGTWASFIGVSGTTQTVEIQIIYNTNGTYKLTATNSITGLLLTSNGNWSLTTPMSFPPGEYVLLTLTSGGNVLMSGVQRFFHPGVAQWTVTTNNLPPNLHAAIYGLQKL